MLPSTLAASHRGGNFGGGRLPEFVRRALQRDQMDLDSALSQMWYLLTSPSLVSKMSKARKMTKNYYHRDDPGFLVLQAVFIVAVTVAFGLAMAATIPHIIYEVLFSCGLTYLAGGALMASGTWALCNRVLMGHPATPHEVRKEVEWQYCFDVHCNGYFCYFIVADVLHFVLLPLTVQSGFLAQLVANVLYGVAAIAYSYVTFRGFVELPALDRPQVFLYPVAAVVTLVVLGTVTTSINMSHVMLHHSWPRE